LAVKIRLRRMGSKKRPRYRFVATDSRMPRDGRFIEILGHYNPIERPASVKVNEEKVYYWLKQGAIPTDTASSLFRQIGLLRKWEMIQKGEDVSQITLPTQLKEKPKKKKKKKAKEAEVAAPPAEEVTEEKEKKEVKPEEAPAEKITEAKEEKEEKEEPEKKETKPKEAEVKEQKEEQKEPKKKEAKPKKAEPSAKAETKEPKEEKEKSEGS